MSNKKDNEQNWLDLANHFQAKVLKRTSDMGYIHTRAGFLIAASVIIIQSASQLPKFHNNVLLLAQALAIGWGFGAVVFSVMSMLSSKSISPLHPREMYIELESRPQLSREEFGMWLADSYADANSRFNKVYDKKYYHQLTAAVLLILAFATLVSIRIVLNYVR